MTHTTDTPARPADGRPAGPTSADGRVADATDRNWVDRFFPPATRPYARLARWDRPAGTWLLLIPCWQGLALACAADPAAWGLNDLWIFAACGVGAILMRGAGCTWNDVTDRDFDGSVARTRSRPIPSGAVTVRQALAWMAVQSLIAFCILLTFNPFTIVLGIASLALVAIYPFMKRVTWWPQIFLGLAFNWGALLAWAAHAGSLGWPPVLLYLAGIFWTLFYDTIYACQDKEDDALIGVKSTARLFGRATGKWLLGFLIATVLAALAAGALATAGRDPILPVAAVLIGCWAYAAHLTWQLRRLDIDDSDVCLRLFRSNRDAGLILFAGFLVAGWV